MARLMSRYSLWAFDWIATTPSSLTLARTKFFTERWLTLETATPAMAVVVSNIQDIDQALIMNADDHRHVMAELDALRQQVVA